MDPIGGPFGIAPGGAASPRRRRAGVTFAMPRPAEASPATNAAVPLGGLLALQEVAESAVEPPADREARRRGHALLAELAALQRDILGDGVTAERLARLRGLAEDIPAAVHPALREALAATVLRARIELARFGGG